jgi:hypothetical protein
MQGRVDDCLLPSQDLFFRVWLILREDVKVNIPSY